jgi:hypothetical protein
VRCQQKYFHLPIDFYFFLTYTMYHPVVTPPYHQLRQIGGTPPRRYRGTPPVYTSTATYGFHFSHNPTHLPVMTYGTSAHTAFTVYFFSAGYSQPYNYTTIQLYHGSCCPSIFHLYITYHIPHTTYQPTSNDIRYIHTTPSHHPFFLLLPTCIIFTVSPTHQLTKVLYTSISTNRMPLIATRYTIISRVSRQFKTAYHIEY